MSLLQSHMLKSKNGTTTCYTTDTNGLKQGIYIEYLKNTCVRVLAHYKDDALNGTYTRYSPLGYILSLEEYKDGILHGKQRYLHPTTNKMVVAMFDQGVKRSEHIYRSTGDTSRDRLIESFEYDVNGLLDGSHNTYFYNGKDIQTSTIYKAGKKVEYIEYGTDSQTVRTRKLFTATGYDLHNTRTTRYFSSKENTTVDGTSKKSTIVYNRPGTAIGQQSLFQITSNSYFDKCPKEFSKFISAECVSTVSEINGVSTYTCIDESSIRFGRGSKLGEIITYSWSYSQETGTMQKKNKTGDYCKEWISLIAEYNLSTGNTTVSKRIDRREEKYYIENKAFGFFRTIMGQAVKEYFRIGSRNIKWEEAIEMFSKSDNSELTVADIAFVKLKYN